MADEVTDPTEALDPIEGIARAHALRMQEISDEQFSKSKQLCDDVVTTIRRHAGFKSEILDKALSVLGITDPGLPGEAKPE